MKQAVNKALSWLWYSYAGAVIVGSAVGILFGGVMLCILFATAANASPSKTLTLDESYVQGNTRICVYSDAQRVETTEINKHSKCKAVLVVDAE